MFHKKKHFRSGAGRILFLMRSGVTAQYLAW